MLLLKTHFSNLFYGLLMILLLGYSPINLASNLVTHDDILGQKSVQCHVRLEGTIRDSEDNRPLYFSMIRVLDSIQQPLQVTESDAQGKYVLELPCQQNYTLEIISKGYRVLNESITIKNDVEGSAITKDLYLRPHAAKHNETARVRVSRAFKEFRNYSPPPVKKWTTTYVDFATDRNYIENNTGKAKFGNDRGTLKYGTCMVTIPIDHRVGEIERPSWLRLEFSEDPEHHIILQNVKVFDREDFLRSIAHKMRFTPLKRTFLFIHGYNVSFEDAALRTAQMSYDLKFEGAPVFYSWPSQSKLSGYFQDAQNISWAEHNITTFLEDYLENADADQIYLIAHSMGNRGLTNSIISVLSKKPHLRHKIKEIILAAPDIDADIFKRDIAPQMVTLLQKPITLYVSSQDVALKASMEIHGESRAGDSKEEIIVLDGIETIDASSSKTNFLGHSYYADSSSIIGDLYDLMNSGNRANQRPKLKAKTLSDKMYWIVDH